jgi:hypothetical protein
MLKYLMIDVALSYYDEYSLKVFWQFWSILKQEWLHIYVFVGQEGHLAMK